jgi:hypothetical protein
LEPYTNPVTGEETYRYVNKQKNIFYNFRTMHHMDQDESLVSSCLKTRYYDAYRPAWCLYEFQPNLLQMLRAPCLISIKPSLPSRDR